MIFSHNKYFEALAICPHCKVKQYVYILDVDHQATITILKCFYCGRRFKYHSDTSVCEI